MRFYLLVAAVVLTGGACAPRPAGDPVDAAVLPDATSPSSGADGSITDSGNGDSSVGDAGVVDSSAGDAGVLDSAMGDAALVADAHNVPADASITDGAVPDSSLTPDSSHLPDGAVSDAGTGFTFEDCCAQSGCSDGVGMLACASHDPTYGRCAVAGQAGLCVITSLCGGGWSPTPGFCPGPVNIQCCTPPSTIPDAGQCLGTERPLPNRNLAPTSVDARCPPGMKVSGAVCVDLYEAFLVEITPDGGSADWSPYFNPGTRQMRAVSAAGAVPQGYINADQAENACQNSGKRLCSSVEWLRACQGSAGFTFPYGNTRMDGVCNDARSVHPAIEYFGPNDPDPFSKIDHACLNQLPSGLDPTGDNPGCVTEDGLWDMMGNLHEWVADSAGTFRGGFYVDTRINGPGCLYATTAHNRLHWDYSTGFRCCADPTP